jgi:hypothetical protein
MQMDKWWLSSPRMTVGVKVSNGLIVEAAPIVRVFIGQSFTNLLRWMKPDQKVLLNDAPRD